MTFLLKRSDFSGGVRVVRTYAERLRARGHRVVVVSCEQPPEPLRRRIKRAATGGGIAPAPRRVPGHLDGCDLDHRVIPGGRTPSADDVPDADVLVTTWWETAEWVRGWPARVGRVVDFVQHDERAIGNPDAATRARIEAVWREDRPKIVVAGWIGRAIEAEGGGRVVPVPNAVDTDLFHAPPRGKQPVPTVGFMHTHAAFKGPDVMMRAIAIARAAVPDLRVRAFGHADAPASDPDLPAGTVYRRQPPQREIPAVYAGCDAWLFGSRCEGFGLPILEAMACRTPVIGTPAGAAPELLGPPPGGGEPAGVLVAMEDPDAMAAAIVRTVRLEEAAWRALSGRAHAVAAGYTWEQATDRFETELRAAAKA
ncbi:putative glycosyltransferase [Phycisphaera mikurensis NBRC 102666]|uniref:Putative glycosyltransferase n=1 Tax=Phycisphaera mikurensis (strain NBRC 102666 / KCTC 22515 / FYK2301M01) TaxID=1142394 RepID=I0IAZ2_PHYMF|nr:putative glycosyltransferase [Phycisphaera mikurensis NBRC 102666]